MNCPTFEAVPCDWKRKGDEAWAKMSIVLQGGEVAEQAERHEEEKEAKKKMSCQFWPSYIW
jgi:hypothetical protein